MADNEKTVHDFSFREEVASFKVYIPRDGGLVYHIEAMDYRGNVIGVVRYACQPDQTFRVYDMNGSLYIVVY